MYINGSLGTLRADLIGGCSLEVKKIGEKESQKFKLKSEQNADEIK
jgi:hypothetical protein